MSCLPISGNNEPDGVSATLLLPKWDSYVTVLDGPTSLSKVQSSCLAGDRLANALVSRRLGYVLGWLDARFSHAFLILQWVWQGCCFPLRILQFGYPWCILAAYLATALENNPQHWEENQKFCIWHLSGYEYESSRCHIMASRWTLHVACLCGTMYRQLHYKPTQLYLKGN